MEQAGGTERPAPDPAGCWQAVLARDESYDGAFVYAVRSTGVYCRPSCPSRRPDVGQVVFFERPEAAERAGFRPCLRCRPSNGAAPGRSAQGVQRACRYIEAHLDERLTLDELAREAGVSASHLLRVFRQTLGITPHEYAGQCRLATFKRRVREGHNVTEALYEAGYGSSSRLYERAGSRLGMTPAGYRRGGQGIAIEYATAVCPLGRLLVAATARGVCSVKLGDSAAVLETALRTEYPNAEIRRPSSRLQRWIEQILASFRKPRSAIRNFELPLDLRATAFQMQVWRELQRIPRGETRSYGEIARAVGKPRAARAVARACAANPVALVVPCHRVVRADGSPGGYRWGAVRKRQLLEIERA